VFETHCKIGGKKPEKEGERLKERIPHPARRPKRRAKCQTEIICGSPRLKKILLPEGKQ